MYVCMYVEWGVGCVVNKGRWGGWWLADFDPSQFRNRCPSLLGVFRGSWVVGCQRRSTITSPGHRRRGDNFDFGSVRWPPLVCV